MTAISPPQTLSHSRIRGGWGSQPKEKLMSTKYQIIVLVQNKEKQFYKTIGKREEVKKTSY